MASRRDFIRIALGSTGTLLLAACSAPAATPPPAKPTDVPAKPAAPAAAQPTAAPAAQKPAQAAPAAAAPTGRIVLAMDAEPVMMDPHQQREVSSRRLVAPIFDSLLEYAPDSFTLRPALAERWEIAPNGLTYTF